MKAAILSSRCAVRHAVLRWVALVLLLAVPQAAPAASGGIGAVRAALARSDYEAAEKLLDELGPAGGRGEGLVLRTRLLLWTGRYAEAVKTGRRASRRSTKLKVAVAPWLAEAQVRLGKMDEAIRTLEAVSSEAEAHRARLLLGELYIATGRRSEARTPLMDLVQDYNNDVIKDDDPAGLSMVGRAAHLLRSAHDANEAFNEAERVGSSDRLESGFR